MTLHLDPLRVKFEGPVYKPKFKVTGIHGKNIVRICIHHASYHVTSSFHIIGHCGVRRVLRTRDVSQWEATQREAELQRFSSVPLCVASRWLISLVRKPRRTQGSLAVEANNALRAIPDCLAVTSQTMLWTCDKMTTLRQFQCMRNMAAF